MNPVVFLLLACAACVGVAVARGEDPLPRPTATDRYAKMAMRSPFAPPSPVQPVVAPPPPPPGPKWSDELAITGVTQQGGVYFATVLDKAKNERFLLQSNKEDLDHQLAVTTVQWGDQADQTTVTLRHNAEFATVHFEVGTAARAPGPAVVPGLGVPFPTGPRQFRSPAVAQPQTTPTVVRRLPPIRANPQGPAAAPPPPKVMRRPGSADDEG